MDEVWELFEDVEPEVPDWYMLVRPVTPRVRLALAHLALHDLNWVCVDLTKQAATLLREHRPAD